MRAPVVVGGAIPPQQVPALRALGVADVFGPGRPLDDLAGWVDKTHRTSR